MRLQLQMMERSLKTEEPEKLTKYVSSLVEQIDSLTRLAETFSRFGSLPELNFEIFDLSDIIHKAIDAIPEDTVVAQLPEGNFPFNGDHLQMLRVLNNLIKNALQSIPNDRTPDIKVKLEVQKEQYLITITDNGIGIQEEDLERIFEPRFTTKTSGMGLGLAIVRAIILGHKGKIFAKSTLGSGSTFYLYLPK
jgi:signal transduction histidine kinase